MKSWMTSKPYPDTPAYTPNRPIPICVSDHAVSKHLRFRAGAVWLEAATVEEMQRKIAQHFGRPA